MTPRMPILRFVWAILVLAAIGSAQKNTPTTPANPQSETNAPSHQAVLNWKPSPDAQNPGAKLTYWIYRADGKLTRKKKPTCVGKYEKIAEVAGTVTTYTDTTVKAKHVYCYYAKSVLQEKPGRPGPRSETVIAIIPPDKN